MDLVQTKQADAARLEQHLVVRIETDAQVVHDLVVRGHAAQLLLELREGPLDA